jgi:hypothetical protein
MNQCRRAVVRRALVAVSWLAWFLVSQSLLAADTPKPGIKDYGVKDYLRTSRDLPHAEDHPWKLVCTMPYNCQFQPAIVFDAPAGQTIRFNSSNPLVLYLTPTETCTTEAGEHTYEAKKWVSGEGAIYTIPAGATVKSVQYRETGYDTTFAGSFECNDNDYNILWKKAARTAYLCMRDHFYDCPDRERVGFWGDGTPELDQCFYLFLGNPSGATPEPAIAWTMARCRGGEEVIASLAERGATATARCLG